MAFFSAFSQNFVSTPRSRTSTLFAPPARLGYLSPESKTPRIVIRRRGVYEQLGRLRNFTISYERVFRQLHEMFHQWTSPIHL